MLQASSWKLQTPGARNCFHSQSCIDCPTPDPFPTVRSQPQPFQETQTQCTAQDLTPKQSTQVAYALAGKDDLMLAGVVSGQARAQLPTGTTIQQRSPTQAQRPPTRMSARELLHEVDKLHHFVTTMSPLPAADYLRGIRFPVQKATTSIQDSHQPLSQEPWSQQAWPPLIQTNNKSLCPANLDSSSTMLCSPSSTQDILPDEDQSQTACDRTDGDDLFAEQHEPHEAGTSSKPEDSTPGHYYWCVDGRWCSVREAGLGIPTSLYTRPQPPAVSQSISDKAASEAEIQPVARIRLQQQQHQAPSKRLRWKEQHHSSHATPTSEARTLELVEYQRKSTCTCQPGCFTFKSCNCRIWQLILMHDLLTGAGTCKECGRADGAGLVGMSSSCLCSIRAGQPGSLRNCFGWLS